MAKDFQIRITADDRATATIKKIEAVIAGFTAPIEKAQRRMDFVKSKLEAVGDAARNAVSSVASIIPGLSAIGGIASVAGLTALASKFASFGYNVSQTSNLIGVSARELQAWQIVGQKAHMTADEVSSGLMGMNDAIRGAALGTNSTAAGILTQLGVTIKKNKDGRVGSSRHRQRDRKPKAGKRKGGSCQRAWRAFEACRKQERGQRSGGCDEQPSSEVAGRGRSRS